MSIVNLTKSIRAVYPNVITFTLLLFIILLSNFQIIYADLNFMEQALYFTANAHIHSVKDLVNIYLHPKMFYGITPFFRPSGHYLIYQLLTPIIGWHDTRALILINYVFLAVTGLFLIKLYQALFPKAKWGGLLAVAIFFMHPALVSSRLIIMHFEFAYTAFTLISLYCFMGFCRDQQNLNYSLFGLSLFFYMVAVTFKESALMLAPVLLLYAYLFAFKKTDKQKEYRKLSLLLVIIFISLGIYLTFPWPSFTNPIKAQAGFLNILESGKKFFSILLLASEDRVKMQDYAGSHLMFCNAIFPFCSQLILLFFAWLTIVLSVLAGLKKIILPQNSHLPLLFLFLTAMIFLLLPLAWAVSQPWHLNLSLIFLAMLMAFFVEFTIQVLFKKMESKISLILIMLVIVTTWFVNKTNIDYYQTDLEFAFALRLNYNALHHPPKLLTKLDQNDVLLVENKTLTMDYLLGAGIYPFTFLDSEDKVKFFQTRRYFSIPYHNYYNSHLFKWALLNSAIKEELFPFSVNKMEKLPGNMIYNWFKKVNVIHCVGYDQAGQWHDKTPQFKQGLKSEFTKRHLILNSYQSRAKTEFKGVAYYKLSMSVADPLLCQYVCDQDPGCDGFNSISTEKVLARGKAYCYFLKTDFREQSESNYCTGYRKIKV